MTLAAEQVAGPGTVVTCPRCHAVVGVLRKSLYQHWTFGLDAIDHRPEQRPTPDANGTLSATCRACGEPYSAIETSLRHGRRLTVHTAFGWLGSLPASEGLQKPVLEP